MKTIIHSNGSKWNGQKPDTIDQLIEVLKTETIEEHFFFKFKKRFGDGTFEWVVGCPIDKIGKNEYRFFGNFERLSHVFRIDTTDKAVIAKLKTAIVNNPGWKRGIENLKVKAKFNY